MPNKLLLLTLPIPAICDSTDAASQLARLVRAHDRTLNSSNLVQLPMVDGGRGTIDFLVSTTLGSFLEVEASGANGENVVVPLGFAGEDGKLAVIEMARLAGVARPGDPGTTAGIGQLIQDALDEGAFSILLGLKEPIAYDAGLGAAAALGIRFLNSEKNELDFTKPGVDPLDVMHVDASGRSFSLLSSRIFIARSVNDPDGKAERASPTVPESSLHLDSLKHLEEIVQRDVGIRPSIAELSSSAVEFGLTALLGAEIHDGWSLVLEASRIKEAIDRGEFSGMIVLTPSREALANSAMSEFMEFTRSRIKRRAIIVTEGKSNSHLPTNENGTVQESCFYLSNVQIFQSPLTEGSSTEEKRRDMLARLEKVIPLAVESLQSVLATDHTSTKGTRG